MSSRNVTLSMPEDLVRRARVHAAEHDMSMSELVRELLARTVDASPDDYVHRTHPLGTKVDVAKIGDVLDQLDALDAGERDVSSPS